MKPNILTFIFAALFLSQLLKAETIVNSDDLQLKVIFVGKKYPLPSPDGNINCELTDLNSNQIDTIIYEPEASYFYQADLFDADGAPVSKTALGQHVGSHFSDLDSVLSKKSQIRFDTYKNVNGAGNRVYLSFSGNDIETMPRKINVVTSYRTRCSKQASPLDLFEITHTGEYTLRLHFQVFELAASHAESVKLIRFPPVEVKFLAEPEDIRTKKITAMPESQLPLTSTTLDQSQVITPAAIKSSKTLNIVHPTLTFSGYTSPDAALATWIWAYRQGDITNMLRSLTPDARNEWKSMFAGLNSNQIKEATKHMANLVGYTVRKMDMVSDSEVILSYTLMGSDGVQKMIIKKYGNEWKVEGPSQNSQIIQTSTPARQIR